MSHELKNPLTSLRSAVETLPIARTDEQRTRLLADHPARRAAARPADHRHLRCLAPRRGTGPRGHRAGRHRAAARDRRRRSHARRGVGDRRQISADARPGPMGQGCVLRARPRQPPGPGLQQSDRQRRCPSRRRRRSFASTASREAGRIVIVVDDDGPGIRADNVEHIFERFYTDRPTTPTSSARTPASASRSRGRSSRRIAAPSRRRTGEARWQRRRRALHRLPAGNDAVVSIIVHATAVLGGCTRHPHPRAVGLGQIDAGGGPDPRGRAARRRRQRPAFSAAAGGSSRLAIGPHGRPNGAARPRHRRCIGTSESAVIRLVVDLVIPTTLARMPEEPELFTERS